MVEPSTRQTALVTGASAGIGVELAMQFAAAGYNIVLTARRTAPMEELAERLRSKHNVGVDVLPADLSRPQAAQAIYDFTSGKQIDIDVLINNAGFGAKGSFAESDLQTMLQMLQVNITSLVHLTRLYLPGMIERRRGGVMNLASTAAFVPGPLMSVYYASKAFVLSFSEALAQETRGSGLTVTCVCPGATATEFQARAGMEDSPLFRGPFVMSAHDVAAQALAGFQRGKSLVVTGALNQLAVGASRLVSPSAASRLARLAQER